MKNSPIKTALIVDDNEISLRMLNMFLRNMGFKTYQTTDPEEAVMVLPAIQVDLCIFDHYMPEMSGIELCKKIKKKRPEIPVIIYSGSFSLAESWQAKVAGARELILKNGNMEPLKLCINEILSCV